MIYFFKANSNKVSFLYRKIKRNTSYKSNKNGGRNDEYWGAEEGEEFKKFTLLLFLEVL